MEFSVAMTKFFRSLRNKYYTVGRDERRFKIIKKMKAINRDLIINGKATSLNRLIARWYRYKGFIVQQQVAYGGKTVYHISFAQLDNA